MKNRNTKWYTMDKKAIALVLIILVTLPLITGCVEEEIKNHKPLVTFSYPQDGIIVSQLVMISGMAFDPDGNDSLIRVEVRINDDEWSIADGTTKWSFEWRAYEIDNGLHNIHVRAWDGTDHSDVEEINVRVGA